MTGGQASLEEPGTLFSLRPAAREDWVAVEFHPAAERSGGYVHGGAVASLAEAIALRLGGNETTWSTEVDFLSPVISRGLEVRVEVEESRRVSLLGMREDEICFIARSLDLGSGGAAIEPIDADRTSHACRSESVEDRQHREEFRRRAGISITALSEDAVELCWRRPIGMSTDEPPPIGALVDCSGLLLRLPQARDHVGYTRSLEYRLSVGVTALDCVHARGALDLRDSRHALFRVELETCEGLSLGRGQAVYRLRGVGRDALEVE
jgi:hypothetical protein